MYFSKMKAFGLALPLLFAASTSQAVLVITADLTLSGGATSSAITTATGPVASLTQVDLGLPAAGPTFVNIIASTGAPSGFLQDTQFNFNLPVDAVLNVSIVDNDYVAVADGNLAFSTVSNSSSIQNTSVDFVADVNGTTLFSGPLVQAGQVVGSALIPFTAGQTYAMSHTYVFTNLGGAMSNVNLTTTTQVPEPSMVALMGAGLLGLGFVGFRKKSL